MQSQVLMSGRSAKQLKDGDSGKSTKKSLQSSHNSWMSRWIRPIYNDVAIEDVRTELFGPKPVKSLTVGEKKSCEIANAKPDRIFATGGRESCEIADSGNPISSENDGFSSSSLKIDRDIDKSQAFRYPLCDKKLGRSSNASHDLVRTQSAADRVCATSKSSQGNAVVSAGSKGGNWFSYFSGIRSLANNDGLSQHRLQDFVGDVETERFSSASHRPKNNFLRLSTFFGRDAMGLKVLPSINDSADDEIKRFGVVRASKVTIRNESSAETEAMDFDSSSKDNMNSHSSNDVSKTQSLDMDSADPENRWVKRLKISSRNSDSSEKNPCNENKSKSIIRSGQQTPQDERRYVEDLNLRDKSKSLSKKDDDDIKGSEGLISHQWIRRWLRNNGDDGAVIREDNKHATDRYVRATKLEDGARRDSNGTISKLQKKRLFYH